jgi:hypothetical protein
MTTNSAATRATSTNRWCQTPGSRHILGWKPAVLVMIFAAVLCVLSDAAAATSTTMSYVQSNSATPQSPQTKVTVAFTAAQTAGDLNVVAVGWNDSTAKVSAVTDTCGNRYSVAVGPTVQSGVASQSIYYAKNIASAGRCRSKLCYRNI